MSLPPQISGQDDPQYVQRGAIHVPAGEGITKWMSGDVYTMKLTATQGSGALGFIEASIPVGAGPVPHMHNNSDEAFYLLAGELEFLDGDRTFIGRTGDFIYIPRGHRHRFRNVGVHPARMIFMFTPGGPEQTFIEGGDEPLPGEQPAPWGPERFGTLIELATRYDSVLLVETDS
ncbi:hypothetical protein Aph01nite_26960 [Acrocarpospora phusangensis]|uniref:Cupin type-2 domain-containing protein n=1 Tax=Acrocarpospora phusangensis TaxID=1070424 RepID=A0A919Q8Y4_9ACTN|nr:cupin domain-containing protein [Acrocarpospora phusangensis]GIH24386.1 hypothetical protein Aph01nite_26960 [Acrocarpospora phusangensis]